MKASAGAVDGALALELKPEIQKGGRGELVGSRLGVNGPPPSDIVRTHTLSEMVG